MLSSRGHPQDRRMLMFSLVVAVSTVSAVVAFFTTEPVLLVLGLVAGAVGVFMLANPVFALCVYSASIPFDGFILGGDQGVTASRITATVLAASVVLWSLRTRRLPSPKRLQYVGWGFLLYALVSLVWSSTPQVAAFAALLQLFVSALIVAEIVARRASALSLAFAFYCGSALVAAVLGISGFLGFDDWDRIWAARTSGVEGASVAHFASHMIPALIYGVASIILSKKPWRAAIIYLPIITATSLAILVSGTRSALIGVAVALLVGLVPRVRLQRVLPLAVVAVLLVLAFNAVPQLRAFTEFRLESAGVTGGSGRTEIWQVGGNLVREHWLLGAGFNRFHLEFDRVAILSTWGLQSAPREGRGAHNIYLMILVELGVIGSILWLVWQAGLLRAMLSSSDRDSVAIASVLIAFAVQGAFLDILNRKYLFLAIGFAEGLRSRHERGLR